ncbi:MAG: hypothetical protein FVQ79_03465 [Planctomycetes bacterium]|nr:hypothetical protein [Planctomycetota bacterium]
MQEWLRQVVENGSGWLLVFGAFAAGVVTVLCGGCNVAVFGAVAGYAAGRKEKARVDTLAVCAGFFVSTALVLAVAGLLLGSVQSFGRYGKIFAGFVTIIFGLGLLGFIPFKLPRFKIDAKEGGGLFGGLVFGAAMGMASASCTFTCYAPLLGLVLGSVVVKGSSLWGIITMGVFSLGYCFPLALILTGVSFGKLSLGKKRGNVVNVLRIAGGIVLVGMGFLFLLKA